MPLLHEWNSDAYSLAGIWKIDEPEFFFADRTGISSNEIKNEKRRTERLAGRFLLKLLKKEFPLSAIYADEHDKPRIPENQFFFSISHSWPYVAAVVSPYAEAGIDIQVHHPRMELLQHKFLSPAEQQLFKQDPALITMAWCAKEAAYKWQGRRGVDFIEHMPICNFYPASYNNGLSEKENIQNIDINLKLNNPELIINTQCFVNNLFACSFVHNSVENSGIIIN